MRLRQKLGFKLKRLAILIGGEEVPTSKDYKKARYYLISTVCPLCPSRKTGGMPLCTKCLKKLPFKESYALVAYQKRRFVVAYNRMIEEAKAHETSRT